MQRRRLTLLLAVGVTATVAPALAWTAVAGPDAGPSATPSSTAEKALDPYVKQKPKWKRCDAGSPAKFQCATIKVLLDYQHPAGKRIDVAISRIKTAAPGKRRGVLLSNPGGPGQAGLAMPTGLHRNLPKSVQQKYDLIDFDPRGVGKSSPVSCGLTKEEQNWLRPYKKETFGKDAIKAKLRNPLYGDFASSIKPCAFWGESEEPVTKVDNKIRSLIVQNQWDGQTPLHSGQGLHRHLKGSKMITVLGGEGHGVYPNGNACTEKTVNAYLLHGKLPAKDVTCKATAEPKAQKQQDE